MTKEQLDSITASIIEDENKFEHMDVLFESAVYKHLRTQILMQFPQIVLCLSPNDFSAICLALFQSGFLHGERWAAAKQLEDLVR